jgi:hypothetical protein
MFNDREAMLEMYETSLSKKTFRRLLLTAEIFGDQDSISLSSSSEMMQSLFSAVKKELNESSENAAFQINSGNLFVLLHESNEKSFIQFLANIKVVSPKDGKNGIKITFCELTDFEGLYLLKKY